MAATTAGPRPAPATGRPAGDRRLPLVLGLLAALPVIVSTVEAIGAGWIPVGDDGIIASRAYDVLTGDSPLLGQFSAASGSGGDPVHSLGPMLYWLLAVPARLGPTALVVTAGLVNVLSIMGIVVLARRRGGDVLMVAVALGVAVMCWSFVPDTLHDIWNPSLALMPFALLIFVAWSVACGEHRLLPLGVVLASFVVQCHLTFVLPTVGLLAIALAGVVAARRTAPGLPGLGRSAIIAAVLALVCWSAPLLEQAVHRPGNLVQVGRAAVADRGKLGGDAGWHATVRTVGIPPWWVQRSGTPADVLTDVTTTPSALSVASAAALLAVLAALAVAGWRRRRLDIAAAAAIALVLALTLGAVAASTPTKDGLFISVGYTLRWSSVAGMFAWLIAGWGTLVLLRPAFARIDLDTRRTAVAAAGAVAVVGTVVAVGTRPDVFGPRYAPAESVAEAAGDLPGGRPVTVEAPLNRFDLQTAAIYALRRQGRDVRVPLFDVQLGSRYRPGAPGRADRVRIDGRPAAGARVIARVRYPPIRGGSPKDRDDDVPVIYSPGR